ncbi:hypothetical protein L6452_13505 [Arctium lappa]|uniref:Uncharacterized protein n=1 Tax=Arctium lappa TaxID=4217 RepID=A0ACB9CIG7_ARCLA|nr:hypothetical protein L6452_13505 [Arctium lappa]
MRRLGVLHAKIDMRDATWDATLAAVEVARDKWEACCFSLTLPPIPSPYIHTYIHTLLCVFPFLGLPTDTIKLSFHLTSSYPHHHHHHHHYHFNMETYVTHV